MMVVGTNLGNFVASDRAEAAGTGQTRVRNLVLPNGGSAQVGPGYRIDPSSQEASAVSMRSLASRGQTAVLTQDTDAAGKTRSTITVGATTYEVDKEKMGSLPEELRPLAEQLLKARANLNGQTGGTIVLQPAEMAERVKELEERNKLLEKKLDEMLKLLQEQGKADKGKVEVPGK